MLDGMLFGGGNVAVNVAEAANESPRIPAVSRGNVGLRVGSRELINSEVGGDFYGRLSVGMLEIMLVGVIVLYLWTRNVQGGG